MKLYYFLNVDDLVEHLLYKCRTLSPLKLQKSLYFLFAFYSGNYQNTEEEGVRETSYSYPVYLFPAHFEAWTYGPVIRDVYTKNKEKQYNPKPYPFGAEPIDEEITRFIDDVFEMIVNKSDFALVDRSHDDKAWREAITKGKSTPMEEEAVAHEYRALFGSTG